MITLMHILVACSHIPSSKASRVSLPASRGAGAWQREDKNRVPGHWECGYEAGQQWAQGGAAAATAMAAATATATVAAAVAVAAIAVVAAVVAAATVEAVAAEATATATAAAAATVAAIAVVVEIAVAADNIPEIFGVATQKQE